jgi:hypothetical protein
MLKVSNNYLCKGVKKNVGFYYKITFPVCNDGSLYRFMVPTDFGRGGISMMDGKVIRSTKSNIWQGGRSKKLDFSIKLNRGNHVLELYGSEGCCDGTTSWKFAVGKSKWMTFSTNNLNKCFAKTKYTVSRCKKGEFTCKNGKCIDKDDFCDGAKDCTDGSDEIRSICCAKNSKWYNKDNCEPKQTPKDCKEDEYQCNNKQCIKQSNFCDGVAQCKDNSDEILSLCCAGKFTVYDKKTCE